MRRLGTIIRTGFGALAVAALGLVTGCADGATSSGTIEPGQCLGPPADGSTALTAASFELADFQPTSCGYGDTYGLERFVGKPTLVSLLAGW